MQTAEPPAKLGVLPVPRSEGGRRLRATHLHTSIHLYTPSPRRSISRCSAVRIRRSRTSASHPRSSGRNRTSSISQIRQSRDDIFGNWRSPVDSTSSPQMSRSRRRTAFLASLISWCSWVGTSPPSTAKSFAIASTSHACRSIAFSISHLRTIHQAARAAPSSWPRSRNRISSLRSHTGFLGEDSRKCEAGCKGRQFLFGILSVPPTSGTPRLGVCSAHGH